MDNILNQINQLIKEEKEIKDKVEWFYIQLTISLVNDCIGGDNEIMIGHIGRDKDSFRIKLKDDDIYINIWHGCGYNIEIESNFGWGHLTDGTKIYLPNLYDLRNGIEFYSPLEDLKLEILKRCYKLSKNKKYLHRAKEIVSNLVNLYSELKEKQYNKYKKLKMKTIKQDIMHISINAMI